MTENTQKIEELKKYIAETANLDHPDSYLIAVLHRAQSLFGYLPRDVMDVVSDEMNIPTAHIWGVATFYHYFNLAPVGKHIVSVCMGTACFVNGGDKILAAIKSHLGLEVGESDADMLFTLQEARCLGACGIAPVIMVDDKIYGDLTKESVVELLEKYRKAAVA
jgi:NADH:ubiquinone oxidoreductase subunit E